MTALCGGGPSRVKPGMPAIGNLGAAAIAGIIGRFVPYAAPIAMLLEPLSIDLQQKCPNDPPDMPTFGPEDAVSFALQHASPFWESTVAKMTDLIYRVGWYEYCECEPGVEPPPIYPAAPPAGATSGAAAGIQPCFMAGWAGDPPLLQDATAMPGPFDLGPRLLPVVPDGEVLQLPLNGHLRPAYQVRPGITWAKWVKDIATPINPYETVGPGVEFGVWHQDETLLDQFSLFGFNRPDALSQQHEINGPVTYMSAQAWYEAGGTPGGFTEMMTSVNLQFYCGTDWKAAESCCPPDPAISVAIHNVYQIVLDIQRRLQEDVSGYSDGPRHANISGTGSIMLQPQTVAVRIETHPPYPPVIIVPGTPSYYYNMGFVTPFILQSPLRSSRVSFVNQTVVLPDFTDQLGYTLLNAVTVDIVELVPATSSALLINSAAP